ncbi:MAG: SUMF1/EgtB/PvdO family nonheme iron enzyme [Planctomycetes bacterium]|nr:SUMF1/EgtB/PvdO family nonheme iron enzyme [Planctomycetota bacterium]
MTNDASQSKLRRAFIVWDSTIASIRFTLDVLRSEWPKGWSVFVPNLDTQQGEILRDLVVDQLAPAECAIVYVDKANANVGFEAGFAVARDKRTILACADSPVAEWVRSEPPFKGFTVDTLDDIEKLHACIEGREGLKPPPKPVKGATTLLLYPRNKVGKALAKVFERVFERLGAKENDAWRRPEPDRWSLLDLHEVLKGVGRVVWVIPNTNEARDGVENAAASVIAGYCYGLGLEVVVLEEQRERSVLDVAPLSKKPWTSAAELERDLASIFEPKDAPTDVLALYRAYLLRAHGDLVPFFPGIQAKTIDAVCVELQIARDSESSKKLEHGLRQEARFPRTLRELLSLPVGEQQPSTGRFVLFGDPGAGKSTISRHICFENADPREPSAPIAVFIPLTRIAAAQGDPFDFVESQLRDKRGAANAQGLAKKLRELAQSPDAIWWFFDGLDEVSGGAAHTRVREMLAAPPPGRCVVTSRRPGFQSLGESYLHFALQPLSADAQLELLRRWIPEHAERVLAQTQRSASLQGLAKNPLMLTLIAKLSENPAVSAPARRCDLYKRAVELLLQRGFGVNPTPVRDVGTARLILPTLSFLLQRTGKNEWTRDELNAFGWGLEKHSSDQVSGEPIFRMMATAFGSPPLFFDDLGKNSGILAAQDFDGESVRYLHRSFREFLAANEIGSWPTERITAFLKRLLEEEEEWQRKRRKQPEVASTDDESVTVRWAETFTFVCELIESPQDQAALIRLVFDAHKQIGLRALLFSQTLPPPEALPLLRDFALWDGDDLLVLARRWTEAASPDVVRGWLLSLVDASSDVMHAAHVHYALTTAKVPFERVEFFKHIGRPVPSALGMEFARIPSTDESGGPFLMGSPDDEDGREGSEGPQHRVTLASFKLGVTPVTEAQYARFERSRKPSKQERDQPAANVSWWDAWLFCAWLHEHARLPTEAQWEYACRAGTRTRFWSGDSDKDLDRVGVWSGSDGRGRKPVASKHAPNPWKLHDMHGNVLEWCSDRFGPYTPDEQTNPTGPETGSARVLRGGGGWDDAGGCRSAARLRLDPGFRGDDIGFRVALCAPPSSSNVDL